MQSLSRLSSPSDLREKLRRDFELLKSSPTNNDAACNFFVTAEHMLDWLYPNRSKEQQRTGERQKSIVLQIVPHLDNGAKHFEVENARHAVCQGGTFIRQLP